MWLILILLNVIAFALYVSHNIRSVRVRYSGRERIRSHLDSEAFIYDL